jgi:hypothetical protein
MSGLQWQELVLVSPELSPPTMRIQVETARPRHQTPEDGKVAHSIGNIIKTGIAPWRRIHHYFKEGHL